MLLEVKQEIRPPFLVGAVILGCLSIFKKSHLLKHWTPRACQCVKVSEDPVQMRRATRLSLGSPQGIQTSLHLVWWNMSIHSSHCKEIRPSFESGHLGFHSTWGSKLRVPLTYLFLKEGYTWGACGTLAYLFNRILGFCSLLELIWPWSIPRVTVLKLVFFLIWKGCLRESLELPKIRQGTCLVWLGMGNSLDSTQGNPASSQVDVGYTKQFHIHLVTSVSF